MSAFSVTTVWPPATNGAGWLTGGVVLIVTDRLPCATAQARERHRLVHHHRAGARVDHDLGRRRRQRRRRGSRCRPGRRRARRPIGGMRTRTTRPSSASRGAAAHRGVDRAHDLARGGVVARVEVELDRVALGAAASATRALDRRAVGDAAGAQVVDLHLRAAGRGAGAADDEVALRHRVDLAVGALQRRRDQRAAAQALGVAERRDVDVDRLARLRERRQLRRHHHRRDVLQLHVGAGRHGHAHLLQHRDAGSAS